MTALPVLNFYRLQVAFVALFVFLAVSCTQSDEQREFERQAISLPENFTETNENGKIVNENIDPDDWRTAPFYQGVVYVEPPPPFPNPLLSNQRLNIQIQITGLDAVSGLNVIVLYDENTPRLLYQYPNSPIPTGLTSISLDALNIARFQENPAGLYRILIEDNDGNIISYGDVKIE